ncbi:hypothetical protein FIC_00673 [Flavobacteriaceae bacterium 3519-10]|nr:hypothetical protein FIC_00673 [Flavobacteriaceae bacterium 3519-10]
MFLTTEIRRLSRRTLRNQISNFAMHENEISQMVFDAGLKVHRNLGPGLLESAYEECLYYELLKTGLYIEKQKAMPLIYEDVKMDVGYRLDFLIESKVVVEIKSVETLNDVHLAQVLTYLKLSKCKLGLLINFNVNLFKIGYRRILNGDVAL